MRLGSIAVMVVVCLACIHCGPMESPSSDAGIDAGLDAGVYAGPGPDARLDAGLDAGSSTRFGQVQLLQLSFDAGSTAITIGVLTTTFSEFTSCRSQRFAECELLTCEGTPQMRSGGMLRLDGSSIDGGLTLDTGMMDAEVFRQEPLWLSPGQELSVTTTGAAVPAFTASLSAPGELELSPAVCTSVGCTRHARTTPLRREWAGRTPGTLLRLTLADTTQRLRCEALAESGVLLVPAAALQSLRAGSATMMWEVLSRTKRSTGPWDLEFSAANRFEAQELTLE